MTDDTAAAPPAAAKKGSPWLLYLIGGALLLVIGTVVVNAVKPDPTNGYDAQVACKTYVLDRLKAPASAAFSGLAFTGANPTWTVTGAVDSQNSFGATIRSTFRCTVTARGDQWDLGSLSVG